MESHKGWLCSSLLESEWWRGACVGVAQAEGRGPGGGGGAQVGRRVCGLAGGAGPRRRGRGPDGGGGAQVGEEGVRVGAGPRHQHFEQFPQRLTFSTTSLDNNISFFNVQIGVSWTWCSCLSDQSGPLEPAWRGTVECKARAQPWQSGEPGFRHLLAERRLASCLTSLS